jgi:alpha-L-fucosidase
MKNIILAFALFALLSPARAQVEESSARYEARMRWWSEARFGLFIHWGLYSVPAGEWNGETNHAEWIRTTARIPLKEYEKLVGEFNPARFNADEWVRMAKEAGMHYITITTKHHDGFCLFDSKLTEFDIAATPFRRDVIRELAVACRKEGMKLCFYHSIMDWHHPDYLPRREWEHDRPSDGAEFERFVAYLKGELRELLTGYGDVGVLWFDGNWEGTWSNERGRDLYRYVRALQPSIIVNNRVGQPPSSESGVGFREIGAVGDFGTPEQEVPATGMPGVHWETCMTMNDHWGFNKHDNQWKPTRELIRTLVDVASKGGNFLLNVGPTPEGLFPAPSVDRLRGIGRWMRTNGEAIYATAASPFKHLPWGRCTQKLIGGNARLYLHVFDWPSDGRLVVPGLTNDPVRAELLADRSALRTERREDALVITVPTTPPDSDATVVVLDLAGRADVSDPPDIVSDFDTFTSSLEIGVSSTREHVDVRYTLDGSTPGPASPLVSGPVRLSSTTTLSARCFRQQSAVSGTSSATFRKVAPHPALPLDHPTPGLRYSYYEGDWDSLPDFARLTPVKTGVLTNTLFTPRNQEDHFGFVYEGFVRVPEDGVYAFSTASDDGSRLYIDSSLVVDNDGLHGTLEKSGAVPLAAGFHALRVTFFEKTGGDNLEILCKSVTMKKQRVPDAMLYYRE